MNRAHRIGQTRPVTVYRLITMGTIEEHIFSVQRFKEAVAKNVVLTDNSERPKENGNMISEFRRKRE